MISTYRTFVYGFLGCVLTTIIIYSACINHEKLQTVNRKPTKFLDANDIVVKQDVFIAYNYLEATANASVNSRITYGVEADVSNLIYLINLTKTWNSLINVAFFIPNSPNNTLQRFFEIKQCFNLSLSNKITYHLYSTNKTALEEALQLRSKMINSNISCQIPKAKQINENPSADRLLGRLIAGEKVKTEYVLVSDIYARPSFNFEEHFFKYVLPIRPIFNVIPIPVFKINKEEPKSENDLMNKLIDRNIEKIHVSECPVCIGVPIGNSRMSSTPRVQEILAECLKYEEDNDGIKSRQTLLRPVFISLAYKLNHDGRPIFTASQNEAKKICLYRTQVYAPTRAVLLYDIALSNTIPDNYCFFKIYAKECF